jgi:hypothetical protein
VYEEAANPESAKDSGRYPLAKHIAKVAPFQFHGSPLLMSLQTMTTETLVPLTRTSRVPTVDSVAYPCCNGAAICPYPQSKRSPPTPTCPIIYQICEAIS